MSLEKRMDLRMSILPLEVIDKVIREGDMDTAKTFAIVARPLLPLSRRFMLNTVCLDYRQMSGEDTKSERLLSLLDADPRCARFIHNLEISDCANDLQSTVAGIRRDLYDEEDEEEAEVLIIAATKQYHLSPGSIFHDAALCRILGMATQLKSILFNCSYYQLDWPKYEAHHPGTMTRLLDTPTLASVKLRGISNFSPFHLNGLKNLHNLSLSSFGFGSQDSTHFIPASATDDDEQEHPLGRICLDSLNLSNIKENAQSFCRYLAHPRSRLNLAKVTRLNIDLRNSEDVRLVGLVMELCADSVQHLDLSTKYLYNDIGNIPADLSFSPIRLAGAKNLRNLSLRLNFRSEYDIDEVGWFLDNMRSFPSRNNLEYVEVILDMAHNSNGSDRQDLIDYGGWETWEETFLGMNLSGLHKLKIVLSSSYQEPNYRSVWPVQSISLPRLLAKGTLVLDEAWDLTAHSCLHYDGSFRL